MGKRLYHLARGETSAPCIPTRAQERLAETHSIRLSDAEVCVPGSGACSEKVSARFKASGIAGPDRWLLSSKDRSGLPKSGTITRNFKVSRIHMARRRIFRTGLASARARARTRTGSGLDRHRRVTDLTGPGPRRTRPIGEPGNAARRAVAERRSTGEAEFRRDIVETGTLSAKSRSRRPAADSEK